MNLPTICVKKKMKLKTKQYFYFERKDRVAFKVFLVENDYTLKSFAEKCGLSTSYLNAILNGKRPLTESVVESLSKGGYKI